MEQPPPTIASLAALLDASSQPIYAVDSQRRVVYCNAALAAWLGLEQERILGRSVEYHSEPIADSGTRRESAGPLTDLCPPPRAMAGVACSGTVGCVDRGGRLVHRRAEFIPLLGNGESPSGTLGMLAPSDMTPHEVAAQLSVEPSADELHRAIRRFRRTQAAQYAIESLLGESVGMRKVRAQVAAAAAGQANVLVRGPRGSGREHVARAIHYQASDSAACLVPIDCEVASEDALRRELESLRGKRERTPRNTLLLLNLDRMPLDLQSRILADAADASSFARMIATVTSSPPTAAARQQVAPECNPQLLGALSTITIDVPPLAERLEDLPLLTQFFLEAVNREGTKQIGSVRPEALDLLALHVWTGELDELRGIIAAAHAAAATHEITPADLPATIHHAAKAAAIPRRTTEKIVLDELLAAIEREVISRALAQSGGNKSAAAELLGMTRPRLYRRMVQLGLITESPGDELP
jgi:DNA-binding NtrC family response regulator